MSDFDIRLDLSFCFDWSFNTIILIRSRLSGGELFDRLVEQDYDFTEKDCITYMKQICQGVKHMHENNIIHLDLKVRQQITTTNYFG